MKVIKKGRPQSGWAKEYICTGKGNGNGGCGSKLLVEIDDLFTTYASYMGRDEEWFTTFMCPCCGVLTDIPVSDPPKYPRELPSKSDWIKTHPDYVKGF